MGDSRIPPTTRGQGFLNSLAPDVTTQGPLMPRIMEMDILKNRQPDTLLGEPKVEVEVLLQLKLIIV